MILGKEFSMVADSTTSSSPRPDVDAPEPIKRALKTYGRRREEPVVEDPDSSISYTELSSSSRDSVHNTAPPGLLEQIPPSSPPLHSDSDIAQANTDDDASPSSLPSFTFGWKKKLAAIDDDDDDDADTSNSSLSKLDDAPKQSLFGKPLLLEGNKYEITESSTILDEYRSLAAPSVSDDVFGGPLSSGPSSPSHINSAKASFIISPSHAPTLKRGRKSKVIRDSDSEEELSEDFSSAAPSTSSRHLLGTSKSRSTSTQPTSEDDMPARISPKTRSTGSRKSAASRLSVTPLDFTEEPSSDVKRSKSKKKRAKVKAPTKKDLAETAKERGRLAAQSTVSIPRSDARSKFTIGSLLAKVQGDANRLQSTSQAIAEATPASDPIEAFSSSPAKAKSPSPERAEDASDGAKTPPVRDIADLDESDNDSDLPDISEVLKQDTEEIKRKKELQERKKRALEMQFKAAATSHDDDDLDLQIVRADPKMAVKEEDDHRRSAKKPRVSEGRKRQMQLAKINPTKQSMQATALSPSKVQEDFTSIIVRHATDAGSLAHLNLLISAKAEKEARSLARRKAEEWKKHGGRVSVNPTGQAQDLATAVKAIAEKGLKGVEARDANQMDMDDDEDRSDDEDWIPEMRGSASPEPHDEEAVDENEENDETMAVEEDITMVDDNEEDSKIRIHRRKLVVSDSEEEENDENAPAKPRPIPAKERYRRSTSSFEPPSEFEQDKENNTSLMYDHSEDKENTAVARHAPLSNASSSVFHINDVRGGLLSPDVQPRDWNSRSQGSDLDDQSSAERRRPFKLISEESPTSTQLEPTNLTQSFAAKLQQASPLPSTLVPAPTLRPLLGESSSKGFSGFSQFSADGEADVFGPAPLQPSFSDLFESVTQKQKSPTRQAFDEVPSDDSDLRRLKRTDTLDLTQDVSAAIHLQPSFRAEGGLLRRADAIFEKEQAYVLEAATKKPARKNPELYVNDAGFLTQTRPTEGSPEIYRPSPSQNIYGSLRGPMLSPSQSQSQPRAPLRTLSLASSSQFGSPEQSRPLRRLRKHDTTPPRGGNVSPSNSPTSSTQRAKLNAFELLARAQVKAKKQGEAKRRGLELAGFLENEAAESDDDDMFGFAKPKGDGDEEDGEDLDKTLDVLMDDQVMDEETIAAELVQDKYKEQEEQDDKELEKLHMAAIQGQLRLKRTRGVGVDDSDEDSDAEDNDRARRAMKKLRTSDRGDIKDLEANEATRAFADTYNQGLKDDEQDFAYLTKESQISDILVDTRADDEEEEEEEEEKEDRFIDSREINRLLAERIERGMPDSEQMDPNDLSWLERDNEDEQAPRVKTITVRQRPTARLQDLDPSEMDGTMGPAFRKSVVQMNDSSKQWFAQENKSRNAGTSRSVGGSAITGHAKAKGKTTATGSVRKGSQATAAAVSSSSVNKPVKTATSMLSVIADKRSNFA